LIRRDIKSFFIWIRSSQIPIYITPIYIILGIIILSRMPWLHEYIMTFAVRLFYVGVMWGQVPGFAAAMPHPVLSILVASGEVLGAFTVLFLPNTLIWQIFIWISSLAHVAQYIRKGIGTTMRTAPNILTVVGLLYTLTTPFTGYIGVLAFPLASVASLLIRVDPNMRRRKITVPMILMYTTIFILSYLVILIADVKEALLIPIFILPLFLPWFGGGDIYKLGTSISKIFALSTLPLTFIASWSSVFHLAMIGFLAITMSSLCTPLLIPGIIWREVPKLSQKEVYMLMTALILSAVLRFLAGFSHIYLSSIISGVLIIYITAYYVYRILRMPRVSVTL